MNNLIRAFVLTISLSIMIGLVTSAYNSTMGNIETIAIYDKIGTDLDNSTAYFADNFGQTAPQSDANSYLDRNYGDIKVAGNSLTNFLKRIVNPINTGGLTEEEKILANGITLFLRFLYVMDIILLILIIINKKV